MIITDEDDEFDVLEAQFHQQGARRFKYGENYWERYTDNDTVFFVRVPRKRDRSSLSHRKFKHHFGVYGVNTEWTEDE